MADLVSRTGGEGGGRSSGVLEPLKKDISPFQNFLRKWSNDWSTTFASALAYNLLTAMLPIAVALVAILGFVLGILFRNPQQTQQIVSQAQQVIPGLASQVEQGKESDLLLSVSQELSKSAGFLLVLSIILAIFSGSRLFVAVEGCMDIVYRVSPRAIVRQNLVAMGMVVIFVLLIPIMVFASALPVAVLQILNSNPALRLIPVLNVIMQNSVIITIAGYAGSLIATFILLEAIYLVTPNKKITFRKSWRGALIAALLLDLFIVLFPLYTARFMSNYVGQVGFAVILLVFFYYFAVILMLGAEINAFFFENIQPLRGNLAAFISNQEKESVSEVSQPEEKASRVNEKEQSTQVYKQAKKEQKVQKEAAKNSWWKRLKEKRAARHTATEESTKKRKVSVVSIVIGGFLVALVEFFRQRHYGE